MQRLRLANKIMLAFFVVVGLCSIYGSSVSYMNARGIVEKIPSAEADLIERARKTQRTALVLGVMGTVLGMVVCFFLIKQIVTPVQAINSTLRTFLEEGRAVRIDIPNKDELGVMALYLNRLLAGGHGQ